MNHRKIAYLIAAVLTATPALHAANDTAKVEDATAELVGEKPEQQRSVKELEGAYTAAVAKLFPALAQPGNDGDAQRTLQKMSFRAGRPGQEDHRAALAKVLAYRLDGELLPSARVWIIRELERSGRAESVVALVNCLSNTEPLVKDAARRALENNPAPEAAVALRSLITSNADGKSRAAYIEALSFRADPQDIPLFIKQLEISDDSVRIAASLALARIGDASAVDPLFVAMKWGSEVARREAINAAAAIAERVGGTDKKKAVEIFTKLLAGPVQSKAAGLAGLGRFGGGEQIDALVAALFDSNVVVKSAALIGLEALAAGIITPDIGNKIKPLAPETYGQVIAVLGRRADKALLPIFQFAAEIPQPRVGPATTRPGLDPYLLIRTAAYIALAKLDDAGALDILLSAATTTKGDEQSAARDAIEAIKGENFDQALRTKIRNPDISARFEVSRALASRAAKSSIPTYRQLAHDAEGSIRYEAYRGFRTVGDADDLPAVIELIVKSENDGDRDQLSRAIAAISRRIAEREKRSDPVLAALAGSSGPARLALISALGHIGGEKPLATVHDLLADKDEKVRDAAVRALADWPDQDAMPDLLKIADEEVANLDAKHPILALSGYVHLATIRETTQRARFEQLRTALWLAKRPEEVRMVLGPLGDVRDIEVARTILPYFGDPAVTEECAIAIAKLGRNMRENKDPTYREALEKAAAVTKKDDVRKSIKDTITLLDYQKSGK